MSIIITGSIAYDHIMTFPGCFSEHIIAEKVELLNISFLVNSMKKLKGGCAPNIAYSLALLGYKPTIMGTVGHDFGEYCKWLDESNIDTSGIEVIASEFTASCFITTDKKNNQILVFHPGAMAQAHTLSFKNLKNEKIDIAIISPNEPKAMYKYAVECKELKIPYIFDPGHQIPVLETSNLIEGIKGSKVTIVNKYEIEMIMNKTHLSINDLLNMTEILIITNGGEGSTVRTIDKCIEIPPAQPLEVLDPTGAGDAYRSGLIKGLLEGRDIETVCKIASTVAVYCVEKHGTTEHTFTKEAFEKRFHENYVLRV